MRPPKLCGGHLRWSVRGLRDMRSDPRGTAVIDRVAIFDRGIHTQKKAVTTSPSLHHFHCCVTITYCTSTLLLRGTEGRSPDGEPRSRGQRGTADRRLR